MLLVDVLLSVTALTSLAVPIAYVKGQWLASSRGFSLGGRCPQGHRRRTRKVQCRLEREMHGSCLLKDTSTRSHVTRPARGLYRSC